VSEPGLSDEGRARLHERLAAHVASGVVPGLAALVASGDDVHMEVLGTAAVDDPTPLRRDALFRIASLTKPIAAAGAMLLVDDGTVALGDPVERWLPELADRRVLRSLDAPLTDTVPAARAITVEDLLTFRLGFGAVMAPPGTYPIQDAEAELGLMTMGPPWPPPPWDTDEWIARFARLPLLHQPGEGWLYNTGAHLLGPLLERVTGTSFETFLRARLFDPLGMADASFWVPEEKEDRFTTAYTPDPEGSGLRVVDPARGGWWSAPPAMANGAGMLVTTLDDFWAFVAMLRAGGVHDGTRVLSVAAVTAMTTDHLTDAQRGSARVFLGRSGGWGYGMAAPGPLGPGAGAPVPWGYGWDGGTGTTWRTDPVRGVTGILFTQRAMTSPEPPPLFLDFWDSVYGALAG
jgi:CubicO group peptidase (beta-lactamase class C family)